MSANTNGKSTDTDLDMQCADTNQDTFRYGRGYVEIRTCILADLD